MGTRALLACALVIASAGPASSQKTTDDLVRQCIEIGTKPSEFAFCAGYIDGIMDMHSLAVGLMNAQPKFCLPASRVSVEEAVLAFVSWARANPGQWSASARLSVVIALARKFPCQR